MISARAETRDALVGGFTALVRLLSASLGLLVLCISCGRLGARGRGLCLLLELSLGRRRRRFGTPATHCFMMTCEATASYGGVGRENLSVATPRQGCV